MVQPAPVIGSKKVPITSSKEVLTAPPFGKVFEWVRDFVVPTGVGQRHGAALLQLHLLATTSEDATVRVVGLVADEVIAIVEADHAKASRRRLALESVATGEAQAAAVPAAIVISLSGMR